MPRSKIILTLGFFIALLPLLGFPHAWESFFEVASGLLIVLLTALITIDKKLTLKAKARSRQVRKKISVIPENESDSESEVVNSQIQENIIEAQEILNEERQA